MSRIFAYCRISTLDQTTENQRREIESAGFKIKPQQIIEEHISGSALRDPLIISPKRNHV
ncbi:Putative DNA-invertase [Escherichia coli]|nr:recombinase family protein [Escherichia coli]MBB9269766.1 recombinase family protein [Escherichia coli]MBB9613920.1 recombinase family protein [Escherichia coli]MCH0578791.1 recombinase family protein [Escherichia coli]NVD80078.1 recombinase family protein [Escherichia coli]